MAEFKVELPKMGESVAEATITSWLKAEGDTIEAEESVVEIATDKVDSEVPSPADGVISKILVAEGEVAQVGQVIAIISTGGDTPSPEEEEEEEESVKTEAIPAAVAIQPVPTAPQENSTTATNPDFSSSDRFYSPLVKNIAQQEGISISELDLIVGSGQGARVTKNDILKC